MDFLQAIKSGKVMEDWFSAIYIFINNNIINKVNANNALLSVLNIAWAEVI